MSGYLAFLRFYGRPQGYETWVDAIWRDLGGRALMMAITHRWPARWGPVPYLFQPGYGARYAFWHQVMCLKHRLLQQMSMRHNPALLARWARRSGWSFWKSSSLSLPRLVGLAWRVRWRDQ